MHYDGDGAQLDAAVGIGKAMAEMLERRDRDGQSGDQRRRRWTRRRNGELMMARAGPEAIKVDEGSNLVFGFIGCMRGREERRGEGLEAEADPVEAQQGGVCDCLGLLTAAGMVISRSDLMVMKRYM